MSDQTTNYLTRTTARAAESLNDVRGGIIYATTGEGHGMLSDEDAKKAADAMLKLDQLQEELWGLWTDLTRIPFTFS
jgi:hypothetical protein